MSEYGDLNLRPAHFIDKIIADDVAGGLEQVVTRFPPEPNGLLHIGSAYAINISYSMAKKYSGRFNLRFDDTNPVKEDISYVNAIIEDIDWLGVNYGGTPLYGSDYFEQMYEYAVHLIKKGKAYVCDLSQDEIREYRGTLTEPGRESPYRSRPIEENLRLFEQMWEGRFEEGAKVLRAKIDMASPNIVLRDPVLYRIIYSEHYRTGDKWCIYPMYDYAHPIQDYIEGITHSLCSNEFVNNRALYDWVLENLDLPGRLPQQIEFGRLNISGVVTSKRYLKQLVDSGYLEGWDDPRLPTLQGLRRRGYTREAIFAFLNEIGVPKTETTVDVEMLEHFVRQDLMEKAVCLMAVLDPVKVVITNFEPGRVEYLDADNNYKTTALGIRRVPLTREIYIEREDFMEDPPKGYNRLTIGREVRLKHGYFLKCNDVVKDEQGNILELHCTYDPETKSGSGFAGRKVKGTIHWVSASHGLKCAVRHYEPLFLNPPDEESLLEAINPNSRRDLTECIIESSILDFIDQGMTHYQFLRNGFYVLDNKLGSKSDLVFNRIVPLKSSFRL
ncbi:MAG: glutamine--tRNA ligase/YqeY domain fusion protein [Firmicutes bacterium]|mgnify:CR=1 FL=1|jgi:glutaminyl-tRNA synthetase|nr:glutamine--tRNA ligase/YqeY domain fusion protein [Bacillota bacterium]NLL87528.1 glutamine--tRNA ligase/YqeY domain fusion protein [Bacillota bacterium]